MLLSDADPLADDVVELAASAVKHFELFLVKAQAFPWAAVGLLSTSLDVQLRVCKTMRAEYLVVERLRADKSFWKTYGPLLSHTSWQCYLQLMVKFKEYG